MDKNFGFSGKISDASINLTKELSIKDLTTEISNGEGVKNNGINAVIKKGFVLDLELTGSEINLRRENGEIKIKSLIRTKGKSNFSQIKKISSLFGLNLDFFKDINSSADLKTNINFDISKKLKIKNLFYSMVGNIDFLELHTEEKRVIRKYFYLGL
jgi:hypothetical protein